MKLATLSIVAAPQNVRSIAEVPQTFYLYVVVVLAASVIGLAIVLRGGTAAAKLVGWLLLPIFPVFLIYSAFPSTTEGSFFDFKVTGAFAAYLILWWFGAKRSLDTEGLEQENQRLRQQLTVDSNQHVITGTGGLKKPSPLSSSDTYCYALAKQPKKKLGLITGDLMRVDFVDVWVSSENTNMQMARFFDQSVSAALRYFGAKRSKTGAVEEDVIATALSREMGSVVTVQPATVLITTSGELERTKNVKRIFHVASVVGQAQRGYRPIDGIDDCVENALLEMDNLQGVNCRSIVFPLLGTGTAKHDIRQTAEKLFDRAITYLERHPSSKIDVVYFLNYTDEQLEVCQAILGLNSKVIKPPVKG